jgi:hypothetical protein
MCRPSRRQRGDESAALRPGFPRPSVLRFPKAPSRKTLRDHPMRRCSRAVLWRKRHKHHRPRGSRLSTYRLPSSPRCGSTTGVLWLARERARTGGSYCDEKAPSGDYRGAGQVGNDAHANKRQDGMYHLAIGVQFPDYDDLEWLMVAVSGKPMRAARRGPYFFFSSLTIAVRLSSWCASAIQLREILRRTEDRRPEFSGSWPRSLKRAAYDVHSATVGTDIFPSRALGIGKHMLGPVPDTRR